MILSWRVHCYVGLDALDRHNCARACNFFINCIKIHVLCRARQAGGQGVLRVPKFVRWSLRSCFMMATCSWTLASQLTRLTAT